MPSGSCVPWSKPLSSESLLLFQFGVMMGLVLGCCGNSVHGKCWTWYTHAIGVGVFSTPTMANGYTCKLAPLCYL